MGDKSPVTIAGLVKILRAVPEKRLMILDLAPQLLDEQGKVDIVKAVDRQGDINLALAELQSYTRSAGEMRKMLQGISRTRDAAPGVNDDDDEEDAGE